MNYALVLAGGTGMRFWPFSRGLEPKQFLQILGKESLLQATVKRLKGTVIPKNIYIITNRAYFYEVAKQLEVFFVPSDNIILEPEGKNTAPAIGLCSRLISRFDQDAVLIILPADHYIRGIRSFRACLRKAINCARHDFLVTIGIKPSFPSTAYGYIKVALPSISRPGICLRVKEFLEKPAFRKAQRYIRKKEFFWNSGIFVWKASVFLDEVKKYLPVLYSQLQRIETPRDIAKVWPKIKPISVDLGVMERSKRIVLIPGEFRWVDLGSWDALNEVLPADKKGNVIQADCLNLDSRRISVFSKSRRLIATVGLKDLIIADTPDALLVCDRGKAQQVKKITEQLKLVRRKEYLTHITEKRPWGVFTVLQSGDGFKVKLVEIDPKKRLSLQRHRRRAEHWVVVSGTAKVKIGNKVMIVPTNSSVYVPKGIKHRIENPTHLPLKIIEIQTGDYLEEDDIERFDDDFQR